MINQLNKLLLWVGKIRYKK